ncbi:MAG: transglycosylase SLT domain-containing protein [Elusimicrobiota bacterium]|nr:lytic transglycosylase domain-containing protein [Endomicrobiia bacterium]MDW8166134.1 transglycosylase SLT domain-containing protein [Elusimicrobiota bacterium]
MKNEIPYFDIFVKYSNQFSVPLPLALAIAKVESNFNPNTYRYEKHLKTASYGIFQILESTAKELGFKKPKIYLKHPLFNPEINIKYGIMHIKNLINKYNNIEDVIAAYNMGIPRRAHETTEHIKKIFGTPKSYWKYANQPYVDKVLYYYSYYSNYLNKQNSIVTILIPLLILLLLLKRRLKK